jgi:hypothetical protein
MKKIKISVVLSEEEAYKALRVYIESQTGMVMPDDMKSVTMTEQEDHTMLLEWESSNTGLVPHVSPDQQTS